MGEIGGDQVLQVLSEGTSLEEISEKGAEATMQGADQDPLGRNERDQAYALFCMYQGVSSIS